ncbi:MAG: tRNA lysidine(34) synthetase TilS [Acidobacteriota bacterium]|nr:tRNA lysidine(34) synthetase TilS [Acidobacteriota bacterium]
MAAWYDARRELCVTRATKKPFPKKRRPKKGRDVTLSLLGAMEKSGLLRAGERVGVAVSGGADSVALLFLLWELRQKLGLTLYVLHFNHKLRGRAADGDEKFVAKLAKKCGLPFYAGAADVKSIAKRDKTNTEDAARRERYTFFARATGEHELDKIAVAHTADDQAETVLAHILRGSGITGLGGIHPQVGKVVRPLLGVRRAELRAFLKVKKQGWREDATNRDTTKMRARIRKKLLPLLEKQFQPRTVEHLAALSVHAREDDAILNRVVEERLKGSLGIVAEGARIGIRDLLGSGLGRNNTPGARSAGGEEALSETPGALGGRMIRRIIGKWKSSQGSAAAGELTAVHVDQVLELARHGHTGNTLQLPGGIEVRRHSEQVIFCAAAEKTSSAAQRENEYAYEIDFLLGTTVIQVPELRCAFRFTVIDWLGKRGETSDSGEVLSRDALRFPLILRNWHHGDRFRAAGHSKPQKLKRLFAEKDIDRWQRAGWPVIVSDGVLAWSRGLGCAAEFAVNAATNTGIVIDEEKLA